MNCLKLLAQHGADLKKQTDKGWAPIHIACRKGRIDCTALLLGKVDVNSATSKGEITPAILACQAGHLQVLKLLIEHQADLNRPDWNGDTPLHAASMFGRYKLVSLLIHNHADITARNVRGQTPLFFAQKHGYAKIGHTKVIELLTAAEQARSGQKEAKGCDNPDCQTDTSAEEVKLKACLRCMVAKYCCREW